MVLIFAGINFRELSTIFSLILQNGTIKTKGSFSKKYPY